MNAMEEKLKMIVGKIEDADIPDSDKERLYVLIRHALQASVVPVLVSKLPKDRLRVFTHNLSTLTPDAYVRFIADAVLAEGTLEQITESMSGILGEIDAALTDAGV